MSPPTGRICSWHPCPKNARVWWRPGGMPQVRRNRRYLGSDLISALYVCILSAFGYVVCKRVFLIRRNVRVDKYVGVEIRVRITGTLLVFTFESPGCINTLDQWNRHTATWRLPSRLSSRSLRSESPAVASVAIVLVRLFPTEEVRQDSFTGGWTISGIHLLNDSRFDWTVGKGSLEVEYQPEESFCSCSRIKLIDGRFDF